MLKLSIVLAEPHFYIVPKTVIPKLAHFDKTIVMFSEFAKSTLSRRGDSSINSNPSVFFSVSSVAIDADPQEAIPLQESREFSNVDYQDDYQETEHTLPILSQPPPYNTQMPASIYLDEQPPLNNRRNSLSEGLLSSTSLPPPLVSTSKQTYKDSPFAILFLAGIFVIMFSGIILLFKTKSLSWDDYAKAKIFSVIYNSMDMNSRTYSFITFYIFMYLWASEVFSNIQRVTLAGVVSNWYFHRHVSERFNGKMITKLALIRATTTSFGTVCFGALILSTIQTIQYVYTQLKKRSRGRLSDIFYCVTVCLHCIEALIENLNNYALIYAGISGHNFCTSAKFTTKVFRRNLISGLFADVYTKFILSVGSLVISLISGIITFAYATHSLESPYGYVVAIIAFLIPYYTSKFYAGIMSNTIDALFLCYALDQDNDTNHCHLAHKTFKPFE
ncbi:1189_t:CDS:10 [Ambispora leptoticha]|uniref:Protein PNS1 n=1 Tax=Ambispora leptoticha TaxID=144679 RepID=A0A9N9AVL0_9GLOM|nr:1189_t:CDS:10 [Ambispora leptoticha]